MGTRVEGTHVWAWKQVGHTCMDQANIEVMLDHTEGDLFTLAQIIVAKIGVKVCPVRPT